MDRDIIPIRRTIRLRQRWHHRVVERLQEARWDADLTQTALAEAMGCCRYTVCMIEQRRHMPSLLTVLLWCHACGVEPWVIFEDL